MKLRFLSCAVILAAGLTACNKEEKGGITPSDVEAYMTLELVGQGGMTKTEGGETEEGTADENTISSVTILLCDPASKAVQHVHNVSNGLIAITGGVKTPVFEATVGTFDVFVIANKPTDFLISEGDVINDQMLLLINEASMQNTYAKAGSFIMFNDCNSLDDTDGVSIEITEDNDYDNPATCVEPINLDRLAVKIRSKNAESVDISGVTEDLQTISDIKLEGFKLVNGATEAYLQQRWLNSSEQQGSHPWKNTLITPDLEEGHNSGSPACEYYNHISDFRTITKNQQTGAYTAAKDIYYSLEYYNADNSTADIYCMENNPTYRDYEITDAKNGNTTGLIYQWKATVDNSDNLAGENCFYGYDGQFYAELEELFNAYPGLVGAISNKDDEFSDNCNAAIKELQDAYALKSTEDQAAMEDAISNFRAKYNIKVYTEGIMYYTYYIKDQNYVQSPSTTENADHYYSVMRNTVYDLTVTALNGIGTDIPGGWNPDSDPEDPVDPTNVYMTVQVIVNAWVISDDNITLE